MKRSWMIAALLPALFAACATQKGFEQPGFAFGCPIGEAKVSSMDDLVKLKTTMEGKRTTIQATEMRCSKTGDLMKIDANLNNDSSTVKRIAYKFRWIDREGMRAAEELILSGRVLPAKQLHEMGVIDVLAQDGEGENAVRDWIAKNSKRRNGMQAVFKARKLVQPVTREELDAITDTWVDAAMRLEDRDLKMMSRIVRAQMRRMESGNVTDVTAEALALSA